MCARARRCQFDSPFYAAINLKAPCSIDRRSFQCFWPSIFGRPSPFSSPVGSVCQSEPWSFSEADTAWALPRHMSSSDSLSQHKFYMSYVFMKQNRTRRGAPVFECIFLLAYVSVSQLWHVLTSPALMTEKPCTYPAVFSHMSWLTCLLLSVYYFHAG